MQVCQSRNASFKYAAKMQNKKDAIIRQTQSIYLLIQEKTVTGRKTMTYPLKLNQEKSHRKGKRKTPLPNKNKILGSINQKEQELKEYS